METKYHQLESLDVLCSLSLEVTRYRDCRNNHNRNYSHYIHESYHVCYKERIPENSVIIIWKEKFKENINKKNRYEALNYNFLYIAFLMLNHLILSNVFDNKLINVLYLKYEKYIDLC